MDMHIYNRSVEDIFLELTGRDSGKKRRRILEKSEQELVSEGEEE